MLQKDIVFYLGKEKENGFSGVISEDGFLVVLEIEEGLSSEEGRKKLNEFKEHVLAVKIQHLSDLETLIHEKILEYNLPANVAIAVGYIKETVLYLKTVGSGVIYLKRGNQFGKIIGGEQSASGHIHEEDLYVFTTDHFVQVIGGEDIIKKNLDHKKSHEIIDEIAPQLKGTDDQGIISLFVQFNKQEDIFEEKVIEEKREGEPEPLFVSKTNPFEKVRFTFQKLYIKAQGYSQEAGPKKKYTFIIVVIIFIILVWSVGLGYSRRNDTASEKKIQSSKNLITQKLSQADDSAFLDLPQALLYISDARQELEKLKKEVGLKKEKEIKEISDLITNEENKITKKEEKKYDEFYDLTLDNKDAKGIRLSLDSNNLSVLDNVQGIIYTLSLDKKSLDKIQSATIKQAQIIVRYGDSIVFLTNDGIYKIDAQGKVNKVIEKDPEWGMIVDMRIYNANIYALDSQKDQIYKYLVADNGYSAKQLYFKGSSSGLKDANSLSIDSSVYVGFPDHIFKFIAGAQDDFKTSFPNSNVSIKKIITTKELEKVYAWDQTSGSLYILAKNGTYEREIYSSILKQISDFVVYNNNAYLLSGQKIYVMSVE